LPRQFGAGTLANGQRDPRFIAPEAPNATSSASKMAAVARDMPSGSLRFPARALLAFLDGRRES
jgi:hypothetical protein